MMHLLLKNPYKLGQPRKLQLRSKQLALQTNREPPSWQLIKPCDLNCHVVQSAYELINRSIKSKIDVSMKYNTSAVEAELVMASSKLMLLQQFQKQQRRQQNQQQLKLVAKKRNCQRQRRRCRGFAEVLKEDRPVKPVNYLIPKKVIRQYEKLTCYLELHILRKLLRPQIYFDLEWHSRRGIKSLGRIIFQLFTEACPAVVLEFVRCCAENEHKRFQVQRICKTIWLECALSMCGHNILDVDGMEHDTRVLKHDMCPGILSFSTAYLAAQHAYEDLNFTVSLSPLLLRRETRVGVGVLHKGHWILNNVQKLSSNTGKSHLVFTKCGVLNCF